jgi:hypothetical protein
MQAQLGQPPSSKRQKLDPGSPLCEDCQTLDLDKSLNDAFQYFQAIQSDEAPGSKPPTPFYKGPNGSLYYDDEFFVHSFRDRLAQESSCPFCTFFREMRVQPGRYENHKLLAWPSSESWIFQLDNLKEGLKMVDGGSKCLDTILMAVVPDLSGLSPGGLRMRDDGERNCRDRSHLPPGVA